MITVEKACAITLLSTLMCSVPCHAEGSLTSSIAAAASGAQVVVRLAAGFQVYVSQALTARATLLARAPSVTIVDGNHMIVEAKRMPSEFAPFRSLSGPRKKQAAH